MTRTRSGPRRLALDFIRRHPGSEAIDIARSLGWYLGGGAWDARRARALVGRLIGLGQVSIGRRGGYFPATDPDAR